MIIQVLHCPNCQGTDIVRDGKTRQGKQRYCCREGSDIHVMLALRRSSRQVVVANFTTGHFI